MSISITGNSPVKITEDGTERDLFYNSDDGGSGTEVVANPEGEATDELETLQVGTTVYSVGGACGILLVNLTEIYDEATQQYGYRCDKTWIEMYNAPFCILCVPPSEDYSVGKGYFFIDSMVGNDNPGEESFDVISYDLQVTGIDRLSTNTLGGYPEGYQT